MARYKRNYLKELWWNRPWVYIPNVIQFMKEYPFRKGHRFRVWLRNCLYVNWQVGLSEVKYGK